MRARKIAIAVLVTGVFTGFANAEEHRQHDVHEHGGGLLNIATDKNSLMIELSVPAINIVGFEHDPADQHERNRVEHAVEILNDGQLVFAPSSAAGCVLRHSKVITGLLEHSESHHEDEEQEPHHHDSEPGHSQHNEETDKQHADFDGVYQFSCAEPSELSALHLGLFRLFPATRHIRAQVITATGQTGVELSASDNVLKLNSAD